MTAREKLLRAALEALMDSDATTWGAANDAAEAALAATATPPALPPGWTALHMHWRDGVKAEQYRNSTHEMWVFDDDSMVLKQGEWCDVKVTEIAAVLEFHLYQR